MAMPLFGGIQVVTFIASGTFGSDLLAFGDCPDFFGQDATKMELPPGNDLPHRL
jgi:hypothetical protein